MLIPLSGQDWTRHDALRAAGLRPIKIWVPDTRRAGFADECRRQARTISLADASGSDLGDFLDEALRDGDIQEA